MKKIFIISLLLFGSHNIKSDVMRDLQLSNELLAFAQYGNKSNWSVSDLIQIENKINNFSDDSLKQVWISNIVTYSLIGNLPNYPTSDMCKIAKRNISKIKDTNVRGLWSQNYNLYGC